MAKLEIPVQVVVVRIDQNDVDKMVNRFLSWKLPKDFNPDCGISFDKRYFSEHSPTGTNLFTATQAKELIEYLLGVNENGKT